MAPITPIVVDTPRPGICRITLDQPARRHPVTPELRVRILEALEAAKADAGVRAVVLTGSGGHFCGGGDLERIGATPHSEFPGYMEALSRFITALLDFPKPLIAAVEGAAAGGGAGFALACDFIVMGRNAYFAFPFFRIGLVPDAGILFTLPRRIGGTAARRILLTAAKVEAGEAERIGLADYVVNDGKAGDEAIALAERLGAQPPLAFALTKQILNRPPALSEVLRGEREAQLRCLESDAFARGAAAFLKK